MMHQPGDTAVFPKFTDEQLEWLRPYGTERRYEEGEYLFTEKEPVNSFYVVLAGNIRISLTGEGETIAVHPPGEFTGGLGDPDRQGLAPPGTGHAPEPYPGDNGRVLPKNLQR